MKEIIGFIRLYAKEINKPVLLISALFMAALIWLNYGYSLENRLIHEIGSPWPGIKAHFLISFTAFLFPYLLLLARKKDTHQLRPAFFFCLLIAPFLFAVKVSMDTTITASADPWWNEYWNDVIYWPPRLLLLLVCLALIRWTLLPEENSFYGARLKKMNWKPYWIMLLIMVPLISIASTQPDFLATYPKMKEILPLPPNAHPAWWYKVLFELSYGSDFCSIEIFFRGFLVIGFMRWVGKDAILPMACFYCTIHFGKPLGECVSSWFGGLLLGTVSYHTRSIYGGLMVHLGIAWLMELGGYIGNY
jgi:uncharacterized protein with PQ loop repeat